MRVTNADIRLAYNRADADYRVDDKIGGWVKPGRCFRKEYKAATRHARRHLNARVRAVAAAV